MNRDIKFRVWDGKISQFIKLCESNLLANNVIGSNLYSVTIMQYTGLKDNNGVEIYEGDIVKSTPREGKGVGIFKVSYDSVYGSYVVNFIRWCGLNVSSPESYPLGEARFDIEVIGNIYENPGLLKES